MPLLRSVNPASEEVIAEIPALTPEEVEAKLALASRAFPEWSALTLAERAYYMRELSVYFKAHSRELAILMSQEMGKLYTAGESEIKKCSWALDFYADHAAEFLQPEPVAIESTESYVRFDPLGIILAVMPWNYPFWQVIRFAAPALMAGNMGMLKHASNVQQCAAAIEQAFLAVGFPPGVFTNLAISARQAETVIRDPRVQAVTLTGSEKAGSAVARVAGEEIKKTVLELGGSDPFIVLRDADIAAAAEAAVTARMQNAGQSCIAAKRFIVETAVVDEFTQAVLSRVEKIKVGDPADADTGVGPLATESIRDGVEAQVAESVVRGAQVLCGGQKRQGQGYFYLPTILTNVRPDMPAYDEEIFGPVMSIIPVANEFEAVTAANDNRYGLGASIFTKDITKAKAIAEQIEAGIIGINAHVKSDPRLPFGGIKKSGYGRELSGYGIKEFVNIKTVVVSRLGKTWGQQESYRICTKACTEPGSIL